MSNLHNGTPWALPVHCTFSDLDIISWSQQYQIVLTEKFMFSLCKFKKKKKKKKERKKRKEKEWKQFGAMDTIIFVSSFWKPKSAMVYSCIKNVSCKQANVWIS